MTTDMKERELCKEAIALWGPNSQVEIMIEECAELITALQHLKRGRVSNVEEEIADVGICLTQMKIMFNESEIGLRRIEKLARLKDRIEEASEKGGE